MFTLLLYDRVVIEVAIISDNILIGKYFRVSELMCKCGCGCVAYDLELIAKLDELREMLGKPILINSGYRCLKHNAAVGGAQESQHTEGKAADIRVAGMTPKQLALVAEKIGFGGIGIYAWGIHVDVRKSIARWNG